MKFVVSFKERNRLNDKKSKPAKTTFSKSRNENNKFWYRKIFQIFNYFQRSKSAAKFQYFCRLIFNHVNEIDLGDKFYKKTTNEKKRPPTNTEDKRRNLRIIHKNVLLFRRGQRSLKNVRLWPLTQRFRLHLYSSFKRLKIINKSVSVFIYAILTNFIFALSKHNIHKW